MYRVAGGRSLSVLSTSMERQEKRKTKIPFIVELCPHLSDADIRTAEDRFRSYVETVRRIHLRLERDRHLPMHRFDNQEEGF